MLNKLSKKQIELMPKIRDKWINIAFNTKLNKEEARAGVKWLYYISNLKEPSVVFVKSPNDFAKKFRDSVGASVRASVGASVGASVSWTSLCHDSDWASWYDYYKTIKIVNNTKVNKYLGFLKSGAFYIMFFEKKAFVMSCPKRVEQDDRKRLHSTKGMAIEWQDGTGEYRLHGVKFEKKWWDKIVNDKMYPEEIFTIDNLEHRRIAYEFMDKSKMKKLKDFKILDEQIDEKGNQMKIISFNVKGVEEPLKYYQCICPSTGREYFIGTNEEICKKAKETSFKLENVEWVDEW